MCVCMCVENPVDRVGLAWVDLGWLGMDGWDATRALLVDSPFREKEAQTLDVTQPLPSS